MGVAVGGLHFHHAVAHFEDRDVEGSAAEIVDRNGLVLLFVEAVGERRGGRLIDDTGNFETGDLAGVFRRLPLGVVEIGRDRNYGLGDLFAEVGFGRFLELAENHGRDLGRGVLLAHDLDANVAVFAWHHFVRHELHLFADFIEPAAHEALNGINCVFGVCYGLAFRHCTDQPLAVLGECDNRWGGAAAFLIRNYDRLSAFHHGNHGIGSSQVDPYDFTHLC